MCKKMVHECLLLGLVLITIPVGMVSAEDFVTVNQNGPDGWIMFRQADGEVVWSTNDGVSGISLMRIGPDGNVYCATSNNQDCKKWDGQTGEFLGNNINNIGTRLYDICFGPDIDDDGIEDMYTFQGAAAVVNSYTSSSGYTEPGSFTASVEGGAWVGDFGPDVTGDGIQDLYVMNDLGANRTNQLYVMDGVSGAQVNNWGVGSGPANRPGCLVAASDGRIYLTGRNNDRVVSWLPDGTDEQRVISADAFNFSTQISEGKPGEWYISNRFEVTGLPTGAGSVVISTDNFATTSVLIAGTESADLFQCIAAYHVPNLEGLAKSPSPSGSDVPRDTVLTWKPGKFAAGHEVYFGESFEDVNEATVPDDTKVLDDTSYDPGRLVFGKTYYWRVDEVNDAHPEKVWKGHIWQFEVEQAGYPVDVALLSATASNYIGAEPNVVVNGAGLTNGMHGTDADNTMWMANAATPGEGWLQIDMDEPAKLAGLHIWNHNSTNEGGSIAAFHLGVKDVLIEYSVDGETWESAGKVELAQAPGNETYIGEMVPLGNVYANSVKLTIQSGWGSLGLAGLSEVQLLAAPMAASYMSPVDGTTVNPVDVVLSWRSGREAASHQVYISTDMDAVLDETAPMTEVAEPMLVPAVDMAMTYYWKVVEVNEVETPSRWASPVLSFMTQDSIVVDDMESYLMEDSEEGIYIWEVWLDGTEFGTDDPDNGSIVGADPAFGDYRPATGLGRGQSLPIWFDNTSVSKSEVTNKTGFDWSVHSIKTLSLIFQGAAGNTTGQLYVKINGQKFLYDGAAADLASSQWYTWNIDLTDVSNVENISELIIGVEGANAKGVFYVDDIRVYSKAGETVMPQVPDATNLAGHWDFNEGSGDVVHDVSGNGHNGTVANAAWEAGPIGSALKFDGFSTYATLPAAAWDSIEQEVTLSAWIYVPADVSQTPVNFSVYQDVAVNNSRVLSTHVVYSNGNVYFDAGGDAGGYDRLQKAASAGYGDTWEHWSFVKNASTGEMKIYINGVLWHSGTGLTRSMTGVTAFTVGAKNEGDFFEGAMDDLRLYNKELSQAEILGLTGRTEPIHKPIE